jgi:hypothetical protein
LNRFTKKLVQRLAFWRKPAAPPPAEPETSVPETAANAQPTQTPQEAAVDVPAASPGLLARLKQAWSRRPPPAPEVPAELELEPEPAMSIEPPSQGRNDASDAPADDIAAPELSLLARIRNRFRRHTAADTEAPSDQAASTEPPPRERTDASAVAADEVPVPKQSWLARLTRRFRRQPELPSEDAEDADASTSEAQRAETADEAAEGDEHAFSNKRVWIPAVSVVLLALMGTMAAMLLQSAQEKQKLQAELLATQKKLQKTVTSKAAAKRPTARRNADGNVATADDTVGADGDCTVSDQESVIRNLKNCIDSFNQLQDTAPPAAPDASMPAAPAATSASSAPLPPW